MGTALVVLGVLLAAALGYVAVLRRQVRSVTWQLERRLEAGSHSAISIELVNRDLDRLVTRINDTLRQAENLTARSRRDERRFRALIADISHDLRTPLTAVRGYQQLLGRSPLDHDQRDNLAVARRHADELQTLVERLHEYTWLLEAEPTLQREEVDVTELVGECVLALATRLHEAGLEVEVGNGEPVLVMTDREKLTRIVQNLLGNAAQHGTGFVRVEVQGGQRPMIAVTNGIVDGASVDVDQIFDRFHTGDVARSHRTGGLGLAIVKVLTAQLGGSATAEVRDGALTLRVTLRA